jgi:hypothetical protein
VTVGSSRRIWDGYIPCPRNRSEYLNRLKEIQASVHVTEKEEDDKGERVKRKRKQRK